MHDRITRRGILAGAATLATTVTLAGCLGDDGAVPDVSFAFETGESAVVVTHDGGETLTDDNTSVVEIHDANDVLLEHWEPPIAEGDSLTVDGFFESGETIVVRWISPDEGEFADLTEWEIP